MGYYRIEVLFSWLVCPAEWLPQGFLFVLTKNKDIDNQLVSINCK